MTQEINVVVFEMGSAEFAQFLQESVYRDFSGNRAVFQRILYQPSAEHFPPCKSVVAEWPYVCEDYLDEFSVFYSNSFRDYPATCLRLHFFSKRIPKGTSTQFGKYAVEIEDR